METKYSKELEEKKQLTERNIMFAEYLGWKKLDTTAGPCYMHMNQRKPAFNMPFEKDWNWTMLIVVALLRDSRLDLEYRHSIKVFLCEGAQKECIERCVRAVKSINKKKYSTDEG